MVKVLPSIPNWFVLAFRMLRLRTWVIMLVFEFLGYTLSKPVTSQALRLTIGAFMLGFLYMAATSFNDISDEKIDKINLAQDSARPLISSDTSQKQLRILAYSAIFLSLVCAIYLGADFVLLWVSGIALNLIYSVAPFRVSYRGIFAPLLLSISYTILPFCTGYLLVSARVNGFSLEILLAMYSIFIGRVLLKDFRDEKGDKKYGKKTFLVRHGSKPTCYLSILMWLVGDVVLARSLYPHYITLIFTLQPMIIIGVIGLINLSSAKQMPYKLNGVLIVSRAGNAYALMVLTYIYLIYRNYDLWTTVVLSSFVGYTMLYIAIDQYYRKPKLELFK